MSVTKDTISSSQIDEPDACVEPDCTAPLCDNPAHGKVVRTRGTRALVQYSPLAEQLLPVPTGDEPLYLNVGEPSGGPSWTRTAGGREYDPYGEDWREVRLAEAVDPGPGARVRFEVEGKCQPERFHVFPREVVEVRRWVALPSKPGALPEQR